MNYRTIVLGVVLLLPWSVVQQAQQIPSHQVFLRNSETVAVAFGLSCDDRKTWRAIELKAQTSQRFECDSNSTKMWVHINTDVPDSPHRECEIRLDDGKRYEMFFDQNQKKWDLRPM